MSEKSKSSFGRKAARFIERAALAGAALNFSGERLNAQQPEKVAPAVEQLEQQHKPYEIEYRGQLKGKELQAAQSVKYVMISFKYNGEQHRLSLSQSDLMRDPVLRINGVVIGVLAFGTSGLESEIDTDTLMMMTTKYGQGGLGTYAVDDYFGKGATKQLTDAGMMSKDENGFSYYTNPAYVSNIADIAWLASKPEIKLSFQKAGNEYSLPIGQQSFEPLFEGDQNTFYLGNEKDKLLQTPQLKERIQAIRQGAKRIEDALGISFGPLVIFEDTQDEAYAKQDTIGFDTKTFTSKDPEKLAEIAEHEILHIFSEKNSLADKQYRIIYENVLGLDSAASAKLNEGAEMDSVINSLPSGRIINFMNEINYADTDKPSHPQDNEHEIIASFIHSLFYMDKLKENLLRKKITGWYSKVDHDSLAFRSETETLNEESIDLILDTYEQYLRAIIGTVKSKGNAKAEQFFQGRLDQILAWRRELIK